MNGAFAAATLRNWRKVDHTGLKVTQSGLILVVLDQLDAWLLMVGVAGSLLVLVIARAD